MNKKGTNEFVVPFLCLELHCLPSELLKEDYNIVANIISVLSARALKAQDQEEKRERQRRVNRI